jgi:MYXO-CTERM domain-containing protein
VNFLWVYGSEAHPEEHPFQQGSESKDLGWEHPYTITTRMDERAQRAWWMKTDPEPDYEIPMAIDYINYPPHTDNAIRTSYRGAGFYSGFVIDCDGQVLVAENWAWYAPGGEWWGLPLARIDHLHAFLDAYLANPSSCYTGEPSDGGTRPDGGGDDAGLPGDPGGNTSGGSGCGVAAPADASSLIFGLLLFAAFAIIRRHHRCG